MITIFPEAVSTGQFHAHMLSAVAPRPIALASTVDEQGVPNVAPYSFFNAFSSNPPILVFSSNRRVRDRSTKDTLHNIRATGEVVINVVNYAMARQMTLTSIEYEASVNEFDKSGLTALASVRVKPFRVAESPAQFECKVREVISLGEEGGAGNLFICEVQAMHIHETVMDERGYIDPQKIDLIARMGASWYCRASGSAVFEIRQPVDQKGIGFDQLPASVRMSRVLTGNQLAALASATEIPDRLYESSDATAVDLLHQKVANLIDEGQIAEAWQLLSIG